MIDECRADVTYEELIRELEQIITDLKHNIYGLNGTIEKKYEYDNPIRPNRIELIKYYMTFSLVPRKESEIVSVKCKKKNEPFEEPSYYNKDGLSPVGAFEKGLISKEEYLGFCKGNIIKYTVRCGKKNEDYNKDIDKAIHYLEMLRSELAK